MAERYWKWLLEQRNGQLLSTYQNTLAVLEEYEGLYWNPSLIAASCQLGPKEIYEES